MLFITTPLNGVIKKVSGQMDMMSFWEHLEELRGRLITIFATVIILFVFFFAFGFRATNVGGITLVYPIPTMDDPVSAVFFRKFVTDLVPATVNGQDIMVYATLTGGMMTLFYVSIFLALIFSMPLIIYQIWSFLAPGLHSHEKRMITKMVIPAIFLFIIGCLFAYMIILPFTINFLLGVVFAIDSTPLVTVDDLISFILLFTLAFGVVFELPIIMAGITRLGVIEPIFWKENWRWAFLGAILFGGLITPDGSGITQMMVAIPMMILYFIGYIISKRIVYKKMRKG
jgi:sec-independent protein translocase protein TatC